jgi:flagellar assembly protein FliH
MVEGFAPLQHRYLEGADESAFEPSTAAPEAELGAGIQRWMPTDLSGGRPVAATQRGQFVPAQSGEVDEDLPPDLDALKEQAYQEGFAQGLADAEAQSQQILADQCQRLQNAIAALGQPQAAIDQRLEDELVQMTLCLAQQLLRREVRQDPLLLKNMIEQAIKRLPVLTVPVRIHLNPEDTAVLREVCPEGENTEDWRFIEDAAVSPGGYRIESGDASLDDTVETRLAGLVERMNDEEAGL